MYDVCVAPRDRLASAADVCFPKSGIVVRVSTPNVKCWNEGKLHNRVGLYLSACVERLGEKRCTNCTELMSFWVAIFGLMVYRR